MYTYAVERSGVMQIINRIKKLTLCIAAVSLCIYIFNLNKNEVETYAHDDEIESYLDEANEALKEIVDENVILAAVYLCDSFDVKVSASYDAGTVATVFSGQSVEILEEDLDEYLNIWVKVHFISRGDEFEGYILKEKVITSDSRFIEWEENYGMTSEALDMFLYNRFMQSMTISAFGLDEETEYFGTDSLSDNDEYAGDNIGIMLFSLGEGEDEGIMPLDEGEEEPYTADIMEFPESYREYLFALREEHPNWRFVKQITGLDFNEAVQAEMEGSRSLVYKSFNPAEKEMTYDGGNWYYATEEILAHYMDPRNGLTPNKIFQFEQLTYNEQYHKMEALESFLAGTFMRKNNTDGSLNKVPGYNESYPYLIMAFSKETEKRSISPYFMAARIIQEQGVNGGSALISGNYPGYEGYYNYFNIGATGSSNDEYIRNGLQYAKNRWGLGTEYDSGDGTMEKYVGAYSSLHYGADFLNNGYVSKGQDTLYLQKYNVGPGSYYRTYSHQYMQNVSAPTSEGSSIKNMYEQSGVLDSVFVFKIPVYENMPEEPCPRVTSTSNLFIKLPDGYQDAGVNNQPSVWIDGVEYTSLYRNGHLKIQTGTDNAKTATVYKYNDKGTCIGMYVWLLEYRDGAYSVTYEPGLEDLLTNHGFSIRISGDSGIRYKNGIWPDTRELLLGDGIDGCKLEEYGTLAMTNTNRESYPFIYNGEKVKTGVSYGHDSDGNLIDKIFETGSEGRYRFTSVLIGLPVERYKTDYAFRGYARLSRNDVEYIVYGAPAYRSIYNLAVTIRDAGVYSEGTEAYAFILQLISDADANGGQ